MSDNNLIVSVSGIRGVVGEGLSADIVMEFAKAYGTFTKGGRIVLCRDGRPSGEMLRHAVVAGLLATGCEIHDIGIAPTPTCGLAVRRLQAGGAIQITASHNPAQWNGLKMFAPDGAVLTASEGGVVKSIFDQKRYQEAGSDGPRSVHTVQDGLYWHRDLVLQSVETERIRGRKLGVFLDANGGSGGPLGIDLLTQLGCNVFAEACDADGHFRHPPEPVEQNLLQILPRARLSGADVGFVLDPDADRLAIIDENGRYIGEELTLALAVRYRLSQTQGPVFINMSSSRVVEDIARRNGVLCVRSAVGEANVVEQMRRIDALIGGEGNGGVIDPRIGFVRDPFIGMGLVLGLMVDTGKKVSELVAELPAYHIVKDKYEVARENLARLNAAIERRWPDAAANRTDGLRLDWSDRWVHVRPSNTEPIVRVIAEAPHEEDARELCQVVGEMMESGRKKTGPAWTAWLAWLVIVALTSLFIIRPGPGDQKKDPEKAEKLVNRGLRFFGQYIVGVAELAPPEKRGEIKEQLDVRLLEMDVGTVSQRLRFIIAIGDIRGPQAALAGLDRLRDQIDDENYQPTDREKKLLRLVREVYRTYAETDLNVLTISKSDQEFVKEQLGWFGELLLAPTTPRLSARHRFMAAAGPVAFEAIAPTSMGRDEVLEPATKTIVGVAVSALSWCCLFLVGIVTVITVAILCAKGKLRDGIQCGSPYSAIYAETFAVWMLTFIALSIGAGAFVDAVPMVTLNIALMFLSLVALVWPVARGVPWSRVCEDIGLTAGRNPLAEPFIGVLTYAMSLALLVVVFLASALLLSGLLPSPTGEGKPFAPIEFPVHPAVEWLAFGTLSQRVQIFFLACVAAPIVEETIFRGIIYRHLRE